MAKLQAKNDKIIVVPIVEEETKQEGSIIITGSNEKKSISKGKVVSVGLEIAEKANLQEGNIVLYSSGIGLSYNGMLVMSIYDVLAIEVGDE